MKYDYLIVGAGFAGAVAAERLASAGKKILVVEKRNHIGGNAYDEYDEHGVLVHRYGPHIFHTDSKRVFDYLSRFTEWRFYEHRVLAKLGNEFYPIPINRTTVNKLYGKNFKTDEETARFYESVKVPVERITNSEEKIIAQVGTDLFEKFFKHYTKKQWGIEARELTPEVLGRIPVRTNDDDRYFTDKYQFMPKEGYTKMFEKMLAHENIDVMLNTDYKSVVNKVKFDKMIYTGAIDYFFDYKFGKLPYRSIKFEYRHFGKEFYQPVAQVNYVSEDVPFTRVVEHKRLSGNNTEGTTVSFEYPNETDEPFYPVPASKNIALYEKYKALANKTENVKFIGRLAEYKYYNMDQVVLSVLKLFDNVA
jgi:UDP-galactopyranose mutase